jgi:3-dehydroquinate synthetase
MEKRQERRHQASLVRAQSAKTVQKAASATLAAMAVTAISSSACWRGRFRSVSGRSTKATNVGSRSATSIETSLQQCPVLLTRSEDLGNIPDMNKIFDRDRSAQSVPGDGNAELIVNHDQIELSSIRAGTQEIVISSGLLAPDNTTLARVIGDRRALFVVVPTIDQLYGDELRRYIGSVLERPESEVFVLQVNEATKNLNAVEAVVAQASAMGLDRQAPMVAVGGGVCMDVVGVSAALYRRGVPNIKIPTSLVGLIDAGIGTKNAVNYHGHKSLLGTFSAPEASLLDPTFLTTLPERHLHSGVAEMLKMAIICDRSLFDLLETNKGELRRSSFQAPPKVASEAIRRSVIEMLRELSLNLYEHSRRRLVDFGHTFSPYIETASSFQVLHGEAVAIDIAISSEIAWSLGILQSEDLEAILGALSSFELPHHWAGIEPSGMYESLRSIRQHRGGELHLVVPSGIGRAVFVEDQDISLSLLESCVERLAATGSRLPKQTDCVNYT